MRPPSPADQDAAVGSRRPGADATHLAARIVGRLPTPAGLAVPLLTADLALHRMPR